MSIVFTLGLLLFVDVDSSLRVKTVLSNADDVFSTTIASSPSRSSKQRAIQT